MTSNTQAGLFTRVPSRIEKTWRAQLISTTNPSERLEQVNYVHSPVESICLDIHFSSTATSATPIFTEVDDTTNDRMSFIQQQKRLFGDLESAIQSVIDKYSRELIEVARNQGLPTVEVPCKRSTAYTVAKESTAPIIPRSRLDDIGERHPYYRSPSPPTVISRVRTLAPSDDIRPMDSASVRGGTTTFSTPEGSFNLSQLAKILQETMNASDRGRDRRRSRKERSKSRRRSTSRARTVMSYATGTLKPRRT
jgi:hypothetical protein